MDNVTGFLLAPDDIRGFAEKVVYLIQDPDNMAKMGRRAHDLVKNTFLITRLLKSQLELFNNIIGLGSN